MTDLSEIQAKLPKRRNVSGALFGCLTCLPLIVAYGVAVAWLAWRFARWLPW